MESKLIDSIMAHKNTNEFYKKLKEKKNSPKKITKPFLGMTSNINLLRLSPRAKFVIVKYSNIPKFMTLIMLTLFGPWATYMYYQAKFNQNVSGPILYFLFFIIGISWLFFFKNIISWLKPKKIKISRFNGDIFFEGINSNKKLSAGLIESFDIEEYDYYSKGKKYPQYNLVAIQFNGQRTGLFVTKKRDFIDKFLSYYRWKKLI